jgi:hypothetical protein
VTPILAPPILSLFDSMAGEMGLYRSRKSQFVLHTLGVQDAIYFATDIRGNEDHFSTAATFVKPGTHTTVSNYPVQVLFMYLYLNSST